MFGSLGQRSRSGGAYVSIDISCFISLPVSKIIKGTNTKLGIHVLAHHDKVQLPGKGHNFESYIFGVMLPF